MPYIKRKNTLLCTDAIRHNKYKIKHYKEVPQKVVYHDDTFENLKTQVTYDDLEHILVNDEIMDHTKKGFSYSDIDSNIVFDGNFEEGNLVPKDLDDD